VTFGIAGHRACLMCADFARQWYLFHGVEVSVCLSLSLSLSVSLSLSHTLTHSLTHSQWAGGSIRRDESDAGGVRRAARHAGGARNSAHEPRGDHDALSRRPQGLSSSFLLSSVELSDTQVYEPEMRALLGTASHFCGVVVLKLRTVPSARYYPLHLRERGSFQGNLLQKFFTMTSMTTPCSKFR